jgi:hypothetical protein
MGFLLIVVTIALRALRRNVLRSILTTLARRCLTGVDVLYSKPSLNPILLNTIECDHDSPSPALSPLPRDRYCPPWPDSAR